MYFLPLQSVLSWFVWGLQFVWRDFISHPSMNNYVQLSICIQHVKYVEYKFI